MAGIKTNKQTKNKNTSGLRLGISEVLMSLRHYLRAQSQGHLTIDRLAERGVERGCARWSTLKGQASATVSQTNIRTASKATLGKLLRNRVERIIMGFSMCIDSILNWTQNWYSLACFARILSYYFLCSKFIQSLSPYAQIPPVVCLDTISHCYC